MLFLYNKDKAITTKNKHYNNMICISTFLFYLKIKTKIDLTSIIVLLVSYDGENNFTKFSFLLTDQFRFIK